MNTTKIYGELLNQGCSEYFAQMIIDKLEENKNDREYIQEIIEDIKVEKGYIINLNENSEVKEMEMIKKEFIIEANKFDTPRKQRGNVSMNGKILGHCKIFTEEYGTIESLIYQDDFKGIYVMIGKAYKYPFDKVETIENKYI